MKTVATPISKYKNHNTNANNKTKKTNLEEDLLAGGTDVGRTRDHEDCDCPNLFWSFAKNRNHNRDAYRKIFQGGGKLGPHKQMTLAIMIIAYYIY